MGDLKLKSKYQAILILMTLGLFFAFVGWSIVIAPMNKEIQKAEKRLTESTARTVILEDIKKMQKKHSESEAMLLDYADRHSMLATVTSLANESGLEIVSMEPSEQADDFFTRYILAVNVRANFMSIFRFLLKLETVKPPMAVRELNLEDVSSQQGGSGKTKVGARFRLEALMIKS